MHGVFDLEQKSKGFMHESFDKPRRAPPTTLSSQVVTCSSYNRSTPMVRRWSYMCNPENKTQQRLTITHDTKQNQTTRTNTTPYYQTDETTTTQTSRIKHTRSEQATNQQHTRRQQRPQRNTKQLNATENTTQQNKCNETKQQHIICARWGPPDL